MNGALRILAAVAWASLAGCSTGTGPDAGTDAGPDAGISMDAGFHYTDFSQGTAVLSGDIAGTWGADSLAEYHTSGFTFVDGGNSGPYVYLQFGDTNYVKNVYPWFGCRFFLFATTTLDAGIYTPGNVSYVSCWAVNSTDDGGTEIEWGTAGLPTFAPPNTFMADVISPGPVSLVDQSGGYWQDPTATFEVYLTPVPPATGQGVTLSVTVAPPPAQPTARLVPLSETAASLRPGCAGRCREGAQWSASRPPSSRGESRARRGRKGHA